MLAVSTKMQAQGSGPHFINGLSQNGDGIARGIARNSETEKIPREGEPHRNSHRNSKMNSNRNSYRNSYRNTNENSW